MLERQLIGRLKKKSKIIIYGAGMVGELVYKRLEANGLAGKVLCFAATDTAGQESYLGLPLCRIDEAVKTDKSATVIIATLPEFHNEMKLRLQGLACQSIFLTKPALYRSLSRNHIRDFLEAKGDTDGKIDVALMASDNNSASGAFLCLAELAFELKRRGIRAMVILPGYGNGEKVLAGKGVGYTYIESEDWCILGTEKRFAKRMRMYRNRRAVKKLRGYFRAHGIKLVHNNTTYTYVGAAAALQEKLPVVWHLREDIRDQGRRFVDERRSAGLINRSCRIITISRYMSWVARGIDQRKVSIIYDGVDTGKFYSARPIFTGRAGAVITMAGAVTERKGQEELLMAAAILKGKCKESFKVKFLGKEDGAYARRLKDMVRQHGLQDIVQFLGRRDNVGDFFREADIAVVCSRAEPFGRVTVEAQLAGCLVIGADSGATPELIRNGETGLLYQAGKPEDLAICIMQALGNPEKSMEMARAGREHARITYTKEKNAEEVIKVYEEVLGRV